MTTGESNGAKEGGEVADEPICTAGTPKSVRDLEAKAMRLFRASHPDAPDWQDLSSETRMMWVSYAEHPPYGVGGNDGR